MVWAALLYGCANWPRPTRSAHVGQTGPQGECAAFFETLDRLKTHSNAVNAGYGRVARYPYLRTNRFLASFRQEEMERQAYTVWIDHMQVLDQRARRSEIANLSDSEIAGLGAVQGRDDLFDKVIACGDLLKAHD
jgi:FMN phosphatase YigB (HAD superfamily)